MGICTGAVTISKRCAGASMDLFFQVFASQSPLKCNRHGPLGVCQTRGDSAAWTATPSAYHGVNSEGLVFGSTPDSVNAGCQVPLNSAGLI